MGVYDIWASGFVNRWHTHPDPRLRNSGDTTAAHQWRVAVLVDMLTEGFSIDTYMDLNAALYHDAAEVATGDAPYSAKKDSTLKTALDMAESAFWRRAEVDAPRRSALVHLCDNLDHLLFCAHHAPDLLDKEDWRRHTDEVMDMAEEMGLGTEVFSLIWWRK